ncbi:MAG: hypothetical protein PHU05_05200 [Bacilli bacterium]|nr:hypothetical protein [Bacilli bacterium]
MNKFYQRLVNDIDKADAKNDLFMYNNLSSIKYKLDNLEFITQRKLSEQDFLVTLLKIQDKLEIKSASFDNKIKERVLELDEYLSSYFEKSNYDIDELTHLNHINGFNLDELEKEIENINHNNFSINRISTLLKVFDAIILILSIIFLIFGMQSNIVLASLTGLAGICFSLIIFGITEVIQILHDIRKKIYK